MPESSGGRRGGGKGSKKVKVEKGGRSMRMWEKSAKGLVRLSQLGQLSQKLFPPRPVQDLCGTLPQCRCGPVLCKPERWRHGAGCNTLTRIPSG